MDNIISSNSDQGIELASGSHHNFIIGNTVINHSCGIKIGDSRDNTISENAISESDIGVLFSDLLTMQGTTTDNIFTWNAIYNNNYGIKMGRNTKESIVTDNFILNNALYGMYLIGSAADNEIYHNNFISNDINAYDLGDNIWNTSYPTGGNYCW